MQAGKRKNGFSLVELLVVVVIIGILAAVVAPTVYQRVKPARQAAARAQMQNFVTALDSYYIDVGSYPSTDEGLRSLMSAPPGRAKWAGPYLKREIPLDPWGNIYIYRNPGKIGPYEIVSLGADGAAGGMDEAKDIYSWQKD